MGRGTFRFCRNLERAPGQWVHSMKISMNLAQVKGLNREEFKFFCLSCPMNIEWGHLGAHSCALTWW